MVRQILASNSVGQKDWGQVVGDRGSQWGEGWANRLFLGGGRKLLFRDRHWTGTARQPSHYLGLLEVLEASVS